jgi:hypothetical protein
MIRFVQIIGRVPTAFDIDRRSVCVARREWYAYVEGSLATGHTLRLARRRFRCGLVNRGAWLRFSARLRRVPDIVIQSPYLLVVAGLFSLLSVLATMLNLGGVQGNPRLLSILLVPVFLVIMKLLWTIVTAVFMQPLPLAWAQKAISGPTANRLCFFIGEEDAEASIKSVKHEIGWRRYRYWYPPTGTADDSVAISGDGAIAVSLCHGVMRAWELFTDPVSQTGEFRQLGDDVRVDGRWERVLAVTKKGARDLWIALQSGAEIELHSLAAIKRDLATRSETEQARAELLGRLRELRQRLVAEDAADRLKAVRELITLAKSDHAKATGLPLPESMVEGRDDLIPAVFCVEVDSLIARLDPRQPVSVSEPVPSAGDGTPATQLQVAPIRIWAAFCGSVLLHTPSDRTKPPVGIRSREVGSDTSGAWANRPGSTATRGSRASSSGRPTWISLSHALQEVLALDAVSLPSGEVVLAVLARVAPAVALERRIKWLSRVKLLVGVAAPDSRVRIRRLSAATRYVRLVRGGGKKGEVLVLVGGDQGLRMQHFEQVSEQPTRTRASSPNAPAVQSEAS